MPKYLAFAIRQGEPTFLKAEAATAQAALTQLENEDKVQTGVEYHFVEVTETLEKEPEKS